MRVAVHDYGGHPFTVDLSRELARSGNQVLYVFFQGFPGPKGDVASDLLDPSGFSVVAVELNGDFRRENLLRRRLLNSRYGRKAAAAILAFHPDVVLSANTPPEAQQHIMRAARRSGAHFVFWLQDIYSAAIETYLGSRWFGLGRLISLYYRRTERRQLQESSSVVVISEDFLNVLRDMRVDLADTHVVENWGAIANIPVLPKDNAWSREHSFADKFVFLYSGTLGLKHDPLLLLKLAEAIPADGSAKLVVVADGTGADQLKRAAKSAANENLLILPLQPLSLFPSVLASADVVIALLEKDAGRFSVPSKVLSYLCAGRPILLSAPSDNLAAKTVLSAGAGIVVRPGDTDRFLEAAQQLRRTATLREQLGISGRRYANSKFDVSVISRRFEEIFKNTQKE